MSRRSALPPALVTAAAMIAFPLARPGGTRRATISSVVVAGLAATTGAHAAGRWGIGRAVLAALAVGGATTAVERMGTVTALPFGRYRYTGRLRPTIAGVPLVVPAAWWAMALPAREVAHAALGRRSGRAGRTALGAAALTGWDLFLDPQMTAEGYWSWARDGRYRGIPWTNFAGWLITGAGVMLVLEALLPPRGADAGLVVEYAVMGAMEALGFAAFFGDRTVAAIGAAAMLPLGALALVRAADA